MALGQCPYRSVFYGKLAEDPNGVSALSDETLDEEMNKWLAALEVIVARLRSFYASLGSKFAI